MRLDILVLVLASFLGLLAPAHAAPRSSVDVNQLAVDAYRAGELETARAHWSALLPTAQGAEKARILYDLGNVAFRSRKPHEAVGWYTAALRITPRDADLWANLEHARREAGLDPADRGDLVATLHLGLTRFTRGESELFAAGAVLLWAVLLAGEALRGGLVWRRLAWVGAILVAFAFVPYLTHVATEHDDPVLAIAPKEKPISVKSEPRAEAAEIGQVRTGEVLEREDALPGWTRIEHADGTNGWVLSELVFALNR